MIVTCTICARVIQFPPAWTFGQDGEPYCVHCKRAEPDHAWRVWEAPPEEPEPEPAPESESFTAEEQKRMSAYLDAHVPVVAPVIPKVNPIEKAFHEGRAAFERFNPDANPYPYPDPRAIAWDNGYESAALVKS